MRPVVPATRCAAALAAAVLLAACGGNAVSGTAAATGSSTTLAQVLGPEQYFQKLGRLAAPEPLPFIGTVGALKGPGDSTYAVIGLSFANRVFSFQREPGGFGARYRVEARFEQTGRPPVLFADDQAVKVLGFRETQRTDESILYQKAVAVLPGTYRLVLTVKDPISGNAATTGAEITVPAYPAGTVAAPLLAYRATGRTTVGGRPELVLNPRGTAAFGSDTLIAYVEGYDFAGPTSVPFRVVTGARDSVIYADTLRFAGSKPVETAAIRLKPDTLPLGELRLQVGDSGRRAQSTALVSFSQDLVLTDFDEMLSLLRFFGAEAQVKRMREAPVPERPSLWREFWTSTDPNPATPENEALVGYFARIGGANRRFRDEGVPGWRTERGEVFIALGEPDELLESSPGQTNMSGRVQRWTYVNLRLTLFFADRGFGRLRLTPQSRSEFERALVRVRSIGQ